MNADTMKKAAMAGIAGTVIMTVFSAFSHYISLPKMDFPGMIASHLPMAMAMGTAVAWVVYFGFGIALAYVYGTFFQKKLPMHSYFRGMIYAFILWGAMEAVLMPVLGEGFFAGSMPAAAGAFISMALYGATVGFLYEGK